MIGNTKVGPNPTPTAIDPTTSMPQWLQFFQQQPSPKKYVIKSQSTWLLITNKYRRDKMKAKLRITYGLNPWSNVPDNVPAQTWLKVERVMRKQMKCEKGNGSKRTKNNVQPPAAVELPSVRFFRTATLTKRYSYYYNDYTKPWFILLDTKKLCIYILLKNPYNFENLVHGYLGSSISNEGKYDKYYDSAVSLSLPCF